MANQVINREPWLDKKRLISFISAGANVGSNTAAHCCRQGHTVIAGDGPAALTHAAESRQNRGGLRGDRVRGIEAMAAEREGDAKP
jgi:hypothetical protein